MAVTGRRLRIEPAPSAVQIPNIIGCKREQGVHEQDEVGADTIAAPRTTLRAS